MSCQYTLYRIKPGKFQIWREWCDALMTLHKEEAAETLDEEDLIQETCFTFGNKDEGFVFYKHKTLPGKEKKPANMERELNKTHFSIFEECLTPVKPRILGYDIKSKSDEGRRLRRDASRGNSSK